jgi:hypothetical protein
MIKSENLSLTFRKCPPKNIPSPGGRGYFKEISNIFG